MNTFRLDDSRRRQKEPATRRPFSTSLEISSTKPRLHCAQRLSLLLKPPPHASGETPMRGD